MSDLIVHPSGPLRGAIAIPGDKSITHRALMLAALSDGRTIIDGWVRAEVCLATMRCMRALGARIDDTDRSLVVDGCGMAGLREPEDVLHCAGSGTTMRLLAGLVAGQPFTSVLTGTDPLRRRPMGRVAEPLRLMGATVLGRDGGRLPPLTIHGGDLHAVEYRLPVASAQVKSAILLAALFAEGETLVHEPGPSRDHTEQLLRWFGVHVVSEGRTVRVKGGQKLSSADRDAGDGRLVIPGDFSSAAFPMVAASIVQGSQVRLNGVGVNPTRTGLYDAMMAMGANIVMVPCGDESSSASIDRGEPRADLIVCPAELQGIAVGGELIVRTIDEFPIFAVLATQASGETVIRDAKELRVKESDRIATVAAELRKMGAEIEELPDGMLVRGPIQLKGAAVESHRDHRLAMSLAVAGLVAEGTTIIRGAEAIGDSFPNFVATMQAIGADLDWHDPEDRRAGAPTGGAEE